MNSEDVVEFNQVKKKKDIFDIKPKKSSSSCKCTIFWVPFILFQDSSSSCKSFQLFFNEICNAWEQSKWFYIFVCIQTFYIFEIFPSQCLTHYLLLRISNKL